MKIETLANFDTEYSADSVEWCPHENYINFFVCGTYQLVEGQSEVTGSHRKGRIYLFKISEDSKDLNLVDTIETEAILDQKWSSNELYVATSCGKIQQYRLESDSRLHLVSSVDINTTQSALSLSLDIHDKNDNILVSDSLGNLTCIDKATMAVTNSWNSHSFEAWTCLFDQYQESIVYSGGDDCFLNLHDLRCDPTPKFKIQNKSHEAGVTSLLNLKEFILLTGSYDEKLRIFDTRSFKSPLTEINLNGGVWRIKSNPWNKEMLLTACMYNNFSFVSLTENDNKFDLEIVGEYNEHKSICYGCGFASLQPNDNYSYFATCSFYDHKLSFGRIEIQES